MEIYIILFAALGLASIYIFLKRNPGVSPEELQTRFVLRADHEKLQEKLEEKNNELNELTRKLGSEEQLRNQMEELETRFSSLSRKMISESLEQLKKGSGERMAEVIDPFKEQLSEFRLAVDKARESSLRDSEQLKSKLQQLTELNRNLSSDAKNLTKALTQDPKKRGNWGELMLETLLERSGLVKNIHYRREVMGLSDGNDLRADVIIDLPGERNLVIDSKVTMNAYLEYNAEEDPVLAGAHLESHMVAVRNHIKTLGSKRYDRLHNINSPDFVLMFMPLEPAFHDALRHDPDIYLFAMERNVVLVTASTLLAALTTVSASWQQDAQRRNVDKMAVLAGKLYDQVANFLKDMESINSHLGSARKAYDSAAKRLGTGNNNVLRLSEKMRSLGAKVKDRNDSTIEEFTENQVITA